MGNLTREQILARKLGNGVATLPDGSTVAIRAVTRTEVLSAPDDVAARDNYLISCGMTDPKLTPEEVAQWAAAADAGDLAAVTEAIAELSGLKEGSGKAAYKSPGGRRRAGV